MQYLKTLSIGASMQYLAATGFGGIIIGAVLALLFVFILQKRTAQLRSR